MLAFPEQEIDVLIQEFPGTIAVGFKDLQSGTVFLRNADQAMTVASVCKIAVMITLFDAVEKKRLALTDRYRVTDDISRCGTGLLKQCQDNPELSLGDYCRLMMANSDNIATDMLINALTPELINQCMEQLGLQHTRTSMTLGAWHYLMRGSVETPSRENDELLLAKKLTGDADKTLPYSGSLKNNVASVADLLEIIELIYSGKLISESASQHMHAMMEACPGGRFREYLSADIRTATKTGGSERIQSEAGIVYLPSGPMLAVVLSLSDKSEENLYIGADYIGKICKIVYQSFAPQSVVHS